MDQSTFTNLTGRPLNSKQIARFSAVSDLAKSELEEVLGWPLVPADWSNQYIETGKVKDGDWFYSNVDVTNLDPADAVVGRTRLFPYRETDRLFSLDPFTAVHAVKLVRDGITYFSFDPIDYHVEYVNGKVQWAKYLRIHKYETILTYLRRRGSFWRHDFQLAVDADWAFKPTTASPPVPTLPLELQRVLAEIIWDELNIKRDVKSEAVTSHQFTRYDRQEIAERYAKTLQKYVGPRGTVKPQRLV